MHNACSRANVCPSGDQPREHIMDAPIPSRRSAATRSWTPAMEMSILGSSCDARMGRKGFTSVPAFRESPRRAHRPTAPYARIEPFSRGGIGAEFWVRQIALAIERPLATRKGEGSLTLQMMVRSSKNSLIVSPIFTNDTDARLGPGVTYERSEPSATGSARLTTPPRGPETAGRDRPIGDAPAI